MPDARTRGLFVALAALGACPACGSSSEGAPTTPTCPTPLTNGDFDGYESWKEFSFDGPAIPGSPHTSGPRRVYLNHLPPPGSTVFPVGTIIVKEIGPPPASQDTVFAMTKVGCGFNSFGAVGWEWAELSVDTSHATPSVGIIWSGAITPRGQTYGGARTSCNTCHEAAKDNDYVQSKPLQLSNL